MEKVLSVSETVKDGLVGSLNRPEMNTWPALILR